MQCTGKCWMPLYICPSTTIYLPASYYIHMYICSGLIPLHVCPHNYYMCVLVLLYMCPHTALGFKLLVYEAFSY